MRKTPGVFRRRSSGENTSRLLSYNVPHRFGCGSRTTEMAQSETDENMDFAPDRREFLKLAAGGALSAVGVLASRPDSATVHPIAPGIKLCAQTTSKATD